MLDLRICWGFGVSFANLDTRRRESRFDWCPLGTLDLSNSLIEARTLDEDDFGVYQNGTVCDRGHVSMWEARRGAPRAGLFCPGRDGLGLADGCLTKLHILPLSFGGQGPSGQR
jgi:hypothetical protein